MVNDPIPAKRLIGYLPENAPAYADMTVEGFLILPPNCAACAATPKRRRSIAWSKCVFSNQCFTKVWIRFPKATGTAPVSRNPSSTIPDVLVLDEPTDGLDPNQKHEVRSLIRRMGERKAIIFSTHILEEVEAVCSRAIIIDRGQIVANGTPAELKQKSDYAGAVMLRRAAWTHGAQLVESLTRLPNARNAQPSSKRKTAGSGRGFIPRPKATNGDLARNVLAGRPAAGRSRNCTPKKAAWTKFSAASRCLTPEKEVAK